MSYEFMTIMYRRGPHRKCNEVCHGGDCDGDAGVLHGQSETLLERQVATWAGIHVLQCPRRDEKVVNA